MSEILGNIHSIETCGTVDGPGIRFVVFTQGCPMRCLYCHNPDSWDTGINKQISVCEILEQYESVKEFCKGGITVTGGEPLMQIEFVTELFKSAKEKKIHTALDTSGILFNKENTQKIDELLKYTDLVMLDIKHIDDEMHRKLTGHSNAGILAFAQHIAGRGVPLWIRHVIVPGWTDGEDEQERLGFFIGGLSSLKGLDVLPYHDMGKRKYEELGIPYPLADTKPVSKETAAAAREQIMRGIKKRLHSKID